MSQGGYVTLVGYVGMEPSIRVTKDGHNVTDVRVGTTSRVLDRRPGSGADGATTYYTVTCWRRLADHTKASLQKGDPVLVKGRFRTSSYEDKTGRLRTEVEIVADTVGHDLSRGIANYIRPERARQNADRRPGRRRTRRRRPRRRRGDRTVREGTGREPQRSRARGPRPRAGRRGRAVMSARIGSRSLRPPGQMSASRPERTRRLRSAVARCGTEDAMRNQSHCGVTKISQVSSSPAKPSQSRKCAFIAKRANIPVSPTPRTHRIYTVT